MRLTRDQINHCTFSHQYDGFLFDADGTLRRMLTPGQRHPLHTADWTISPNVMSVLRTYYLPVTRLQFGIITNQPDIARELITFDEARDLLNELRITLFGQRAVHLYICPHDEGSDCACAKPSPYRILEFAHTRRIRKSHVLVVGDMLLDADAADRAGVDFCWSLDFFGW